MKDFDEFSTWEFAKAIFGLIYLTAAAVVMFIAAMWVLKGLWWLSDPFILPIGDFIMRFMP